MNLSLRNHILSDTFWEDLNVIIKIIEPMVIALKSFESDTSILSTVYSQFNNLIEQINQIDCDFSYELQQFAIQVFLIPISSAAAERNFSNFGFIHNKIRNRLKNDYVKKLVYIYGNLQIYNELLKINSKQKKQQINSNISEKEDDNNNS